MTSSAKMRFVTICCSHYVERARWAMDIAGLPYEEEASPPVVHLVSTLAARPRGCSSHSVPMLVTPDAGVLTQSGDIVRYAASHSEAARSLYPEDPALRAEVDAIETLCAKTLGVWGRVLVYDSMLPDKEATVTTLCMGCPAWKARVFRMFFWLIKAMLVKGMNLNPANAARCRDKVRDVFAELGNKLEGGRKRYFVGDSFTAADLTFASLTAILLLPEQYGGRPGTVDLTMARRVMDPKLLEELRGTAAGKHGLEMYRLHRLPGAEQLKQAAS